MNLDVSKAEQQESMLLERLLELYAHELSDIADLPIGRDGRFGYDPLPSYWTASGREPYLMRVEGELAASDRIWTPRNSSFLIRRNST